MEQIALFLILSFSTLTLISCQSQTKEMTLLDNVSSISISKLLVGGIKRKMKEKKFDSLMFFQIIFVILLLLIGIYSLVTKSFNAQPLMHILKKQTLIYMYEDECLFFYVKPYDLFSNKL